MIQIHEKDRVAIAESVAEALSLCHEETNPQAVLVRLYCQQMPDKTPWQASLMADRLLSLISRFQDHYDAALDNPRGYVCSQLEIMLEAQPLADQCRTLYALEMGLHRNSRAIMQDAMSASDWEEFTARFSAGVKLPPYQGPVTEQERDRLMNTVAGSAAAAMTDFAQAAAENADAFGENSRMDETLLTAVSAMCIYALAKSGQLEGIPADITLEQVTVLCCRDAEMQGLLQAFCTKIISYETWLNRLQALWSVVFSLLLGAIVAGGIAGLFMANNSIASLVAIGAAVALVGALYGVVRKTVLNMLEKTADTISNLHVKITAPECSAQQTMLTWLQRQEAVSDARRTATYVSAVPDEENDPELELDLGLQNYT